MKLWLKRAVALWAMCMVLRVGVGMEHKFRYYTDNDGLSSNTIQCLYQDNKGYIWVGTSDGLDRFNSSDFTNYRSDYRKPHTLGNNCVYSLCGEGFSNSDRVWVGTSDGLYIFYPQDESFVHLPIQIEGQVFHNLLVYSLAADMAGNIWIGTLGSGLFRYNIKNKIFEQYNIENCPATFSSNMIVKILLDQNNNIWVASGGGSLLNRYNPENNRFSTFRIEDTLTGRPIGRIGSMCQDSFGDIWIAGYGGELFKFELSRLTFTRNQPIRAESYGRVRAMIEYSPGVIMLGTDSGLVNFNAKDRSFVELDNGTTNRNGRLNDKFIHSMLKDRDGGVWVGTYFGGINYVSPLSSLFTAIEAGEGCGRVISKFCEDPDGNLWIGSDDAGLSLYDPRTDNYVPVTIDQRKPALNIHALTIDGGQLWVGTYGNGLYRVDLKNRGVKHFTVESVGLDNLDVYSVFRDSRGQLWIGTKMGICRYDDQIEKIECLQNLGPNSDVIDICEDMHGNVWFVSLGKGLIRYSFDQRSFENLSHNDKYELPDFVTCLAVDDGSLWIGTNGSGLCRYDMAKDAVTKELDQTIYGNCAIFQIIQNGGELWMTTNRGLLKYSSADSRKHIYKYTSEDGLLANIFNANSGIKSSTGHIYIGCNNGINKFYPYDFTRRENSARPTVVFSDFKLFNRAVPLDGELLTTTIDCQRSVQMRSRKLSFSLDFIALNFSSPLRTVYRYRLENFDEKWINTGMDESSGMQHISYTNLPPATYRFVVSASNNGEQFGEIASVEIIVLPPWWLSRVMVAIYGLLFVLGACCGIYLLRRRIIRAHCEQINSITHKNKLDLLELKVDFFTEVANEIRTPIALISAPIEQIAKKLIDSEELRDDMGIIRKNCERLLLLVNQILNLRDFESTGKKSELTIQRFDLRDLLTAAAQVTRSAVTRSNVEMNLTMPDGAVEAEICGDYFTKIVGYILGNAFKFAENRVDITLCEPNLDSVALRIRDDGAGISRESQTKIFDLFYTTGVASGGGLGLGLSMARNLASRMGAEIQVESVVGQWSEFTIKIPLSYGQQSVEQISREVDQIHRSAISMVNPESTAKRPNVLLVENNADFADFFVRHLSEHYTVHCAIEGRQALEILRSQSLSVVVSNMSMEGVDGIALCRAIRADASMSHIPVVITSVDGSSDARVCALRAGADVFLEKPMSVDSLDWQIRSLIEVRNGLRMTYSKMPYILFDEVEAPSENRFMAQVNQYIMDNISNPNLSVDDIAAAVNVSRTQFFARIKLLAATTPNEFLRSTRLKVAAELISVPNNLRVTEICYMVGFTSTSYFAKCFRIQFGVLPTEFMERYRQE